MRSVFWILLGASLSTACDGKSILTVINAAHHGTRVDGKLPDLGDTDKARVFVNDQGWTVTLSAGFVVTAFAQLETCDGETIEVGTPFGPYPEYWSEQDKNVTDFGFADLPEATYCKLILEYGRYQSSVAGMAEDTPFPVKDVTEVEGRTVLLAGYAEKDDGMGGSITHNFVLESDQTIRVPLDLSKISPSGGAFTITGDENATPNLTILKTYDALFQGVDFASLDTDAFNKALPERLIANTSIISGTAIY